MLSDTTYIRVTFLDISFGRDYAEKNFPSVEGRLQKGHDTKDIKISKSTPKENENQIKQLLNYLYCLESLGGEYIIFMKYSESILGLSEATTHEFAFIDADYAFAQIMMKAKIVSGKGIKSNNLSQNIRNQRTTSNAKGGCLPIIFGLGLVILMIMIF